MRPRGQQLSTGLLLSAYRRGWFPMADPLTGLVRWYHPDPRAIFPLEEFHVPDTLARELRRGRFEVRSDTAFERVMRACAEPRSDDDLTWIDDRMVEAYVGLFGAGHAHSVEAWRDGRLVGGLYGVHAGGAFMGESMFCRPDLGGTDASKVCLAHLVGWLRHRGFGLLDTQYATPHLERFGCREVPREEYLALLAGALARPAAWGAFDAAVARRSAFAQRER
jgi:leucyl/phenylalanyl-tRNA--protein transferase